jgi:hypothetical protein
LAGAFGSFPFCGSFGSFAFCRSFGSFAFVDHLDHLLFVDHLLSFAIQAARSKIKLARAAQPALYKQLVIFSYYCGEGTFKVKGRCMR